MSGDDVLPSPAFSRVEVYTASAARRRWTAEMKAQVVAESYTTSHSGAPQARRSMIQ